MTVCVFSGQGAQFEGMGQDLAANNATAKLVYEECSEYLGFDVLGLEARHLAETRYSQPAIVVLSLAAYRAFAEHIPPGAPPNFMAGFSLGEYSMLGAAEILSLKDLMDLLLKRSEFMQQACDARPGGMCAVIGLDDAVVNQLCEEYDGPGIVMGANYNAPGQIVISGDTIAVDAVAAACREAGARRAVKLAVAGAFHTPLMKDAANAIREYAAALTFNPPQCPIYSNIDGKPISRDIPFADYLARHMISPVQWTQEVRQIVVDGGQQFIEFGPGKTLVGLIRRIDKTQSIARVEDSKTLHQTLTKIHGPEDQES
ncbi:MAG TPA: ACP S-malonyltransferase [Clostridiaceae bacterium]|nr:ACP S-malonyltransferase [Clostridiaceae bacterium]